MRKDYIAYTSQVTAHHREESGQELRAGTGALVISCIKSLFPRHRTKERNKKHKKLNESFTVVLLSRITITILRHFPKNNSPASSDRAEQPSLGTAVPCTFVRRQWKPWVARSARWFGRLETKVSFSSLGFVAAFERCVSTKPDSEAQEVGDV